MTSIAKRSPKSEQLDELVRRAWVTWHGGRPATTRRAREGDLIDLLRFLVNAGRVDLSIADPLAAARLLAEIGSSEIVTIVAAWHHWMSVQELSGSTIGRRISTISSWCAELQRHGHAVAVRLRRPSIARYEIRGCPAWSTVQSKIDELEASARVRELVVLELLAFVGLRREEACSLRVEDLELVDEQNATASVTRKGGTVRVRKLPARTVRLLRVHLDGRTRGPVLTSARGAPLTSSGLAALSRRLGLGKPHGMRHAAGTELYRRTGDADLVREWMDHAHLSTTQRYIHALEDRRGEATKLLAGE